MLKARSWSPYLAGALIGALSWVSFLIADKPLGVSTTFARVTSAVESRVLPAHASANRYFQRYEPKVDWQMMLVAGIFLGALVSSLLSRSTSVEAVPDLWKRRFGTSVVIRWFWAFIGGMLVLIGARLAGGCTSGHGLSGGLQLALGSWLVLASMVGAGVVVARLVFGRE